MKAKNVVSTLMCIFIILISLSLCADFLKLPVSYKKYHDFYEHADEYDVLFLGSSHMIMGVAPMELWKTTGICSYNLSNYGQWLPVDYWVLKNALQYAKPRLVVVDAFAVTSDEKYSKTHMSQLHEVFDDMPISKCKYEAMYDLLPREEWLQFALPFSYYHSRWNEVGIENWERKRIPPEKGANMDDTDDYEKALVGKCSTIEWVAGNEIWEGDSLGLLYLEKIIQLCNQEDVELLITALPFETNGDLQKALNRVDSIAKENGIRFFNMFTETNSLNPQTDFNDSGHVNSSGCKKITKELALYITAHYDIKLSKAEDKEISDRWTEEYRYYADYKKEWLLKQKSLDSYLMLIADDEYTIYWHVNKDSVFDEHIYDNLVENLKLSPATIGKKTGYYWIDEQSEEFGYAGDQNKKDELWINPERYGITISYEEGEADLIIISKSIGFIDSIRVQKDGSFSRPYKAER